MIVGTKDIEVSRVDGKPSWGVHLTARLDSGASRSSIDYGVADLFRLKPTGEVTVRNANGKEVRDIVLLLVDDGEETVELEVSVADRSGLTYPMILGRDYLEDLE